MNDPVLLHCICFLWIQKDSYEKDCKKMCADGVGAVYDFLWNFRNRSLYER